MSERLQGGLGLTGNYKLGEENWADSMNENLQILNDLQIPPPAPEPTLTQADWNETNEQSPAFILNKPNLSSGTPKPVVVPISAAYETADIPHLVYKGDDCYIMLSTYNGKVVAKRSKDRGGFINSVGLGLNIKYSKAAYGRLVLQNDNKLLISKNGWDFKEVTLADYEVVVGVGRDPNINNTVFKQERMGYIVTLVITASGSIAKGYDLETGELVYTAPAGHSKVTNAGGFKIFDSCISDDGQTLHVLAEDGTKTSYGSKVLSVSNIPLNSTGTGGTSTLIVDLGNGFSAYQARLVKREGLIYVFAPYRDIEYGDQSIRLCYLSGSGVKTLDINPLRTQDGRPLITEEGILNIGGDLYKYGTTTITPLNTASNLVDIGRASLGHRYAVDLSQGGRIIAYNTSANDVATLTKTLVFDEVNAGTKDTIFIDNTNSNEVILFGKKYNDAISVLRLPSYIAG